MQTEAMIRAPPAQLVQLQQHTNTMIQLNRNVVCICDYNISNSFLHHTKIVLIWFNAQIARTYASSYSMYFIYRIDWQGKEKVCAVCRVYVTLRFIYQCHRRLTAWGYRKTLRQCCLCGLLMFIAYFTHFVDVNWFMSRMRRNDKNLA